MKETLEAEETDVKLETTSETNSTKQERSTGDLCSLLSKEKEVLDKFDEHKRCQWIERKEKKTNYSYDKKELKINYICDMMRV